MDVTWLGEVVTTVGVVPRIYTVKSIAKGADTGDLQNTIPYLYEFRLEQPAGTDGPSNVLVRVKDTVYSLLFNENQQQMHHAAIRFGLDHIRSQPLVDIFDLDSDAWKDFDKRASLSGRELRISILRFFWEVNSVWPERGISYCDLRDNFNNKESELSQWIRSLAQEDYLVDRGFAHYWLERNHVSTQGYTINPKLKTQITAELFPSRPDTTKVDPQDHKYFKLVDTQTETQGNFAFVLMPFKESEFPQAVFDDVFRPLVQEVLGISCVKVDNDKFKNFIENKIFSHIVKCEFVIAELSTENPNVIFELGLALSFNRPLIPTYWKKHAKKRKRLSFDYEHFDTIFYDDLDQLKSQLREALEALKPKIVRTSK